MYLRRGCDGMMVAVGFIPRTGSLSNIRVAARRLKTWDAVSSIHVFQPSRCDGGIFEGAARPGVETPGYHQSSLRDGKCAA